METEYHIFSHDFFEYEYKWNALSILTKGGLFSFAREKYREVLVALLYRTSRHVFDVDKHESWSLYPLSFSGTVIIFSSILIVVMYHFGGFFIIESPTSKISL